MKMTISRNSRYFLIFVAFCIMSLYLPNALSTIFKPNINTYPSKFSVQFNPLNHFRQSLNNCGSYSVAGVLNVFDKELVDPEIISNSIKFKLKDRFTLPIGLEWALKDNNMNIETNNVIGLNDEDKTKYLKSQLSSGNVGILLVKIPNTQWYYLHYLTILGYNESEFFVYDSLVNQNSNNPNYTVDLNGEASGNKSIPIKELINMWNDGNILNYPKSYNIFAQPK